MLLGALVLLDNEGSKCSALCESSSNTRCRYIQHSRTRLFVAQGTPTAKREASETSNVSYCSCEALAKVPRTATRRVQVVKAFTLIDYFAARIQHRLSLYFLR